MAIERLDSFDGEFDAVLAAGRTGAPRALGRIYEALSPAVAGLFRAQGVDDPDGLTSEVFVGVLRKLVWFDGDVAGFRSWVSRSPTDGSPTSAGAALADRLPFR